MCQYNVYERGIFSVKNVGIFFCQKWKFWQNLGRNLERSLPVYITLLSAPPPLPPRERRKKSVIGRLWNNVPNSTVTAYEGFTDEFQLTNSWYKTVWWKFYLFQIWVSYQLFFVTVIKTDVGTRRGSGIRRDFLNDRQGRSFQEVAGAFFPGKFFGF